VLHAGHFHDMNAEQCNACPEGRAPESCVRQWPRKGCAGTGSAVGYDGLSVTPKMMPNKPRRLPRIRKSRRVDVTRAEFDRVIDLLNKRGEIVDQMRRDLEAVDDVRRDLDVQFKRIAQLQEEVDRLKRQRD
jgi:hypothetical protein